MDKIISIGSECKKMFPHGFCHGLIHSVFDRVVNIETDVTCTIDNLFSVCVCDVPPAPARIVVDSKSSWLYRGMEPGQRFSISCGSEPVWYGIHDYTIATPEVILQRLSKITLPENAELIGIAYNNVEALIGRGLGLTPAGDDFLTGVLYSLHFLRCNSLLELLSEKMENHLYKTTRLSRHFLKYALAGKWGQTEQDVMFALLTNSDVNLDEAIDKQLAVGSSSGADELSGMLVGIRAALEEQAVGGRGR